MKIRYNVDVDTGLPHVYRHNVSEDEVEDVLRDPIERRRGEGDSQVLIGRTTQGRYLRVIVSLDRDGDGVFVITGYDLGVKAIKALRRRLKKRGLR
jgi:hypothetical protein